MARRSYKVQQLMKRLREHMLDVRAVDEASNRNGYSPHRPLSQFEVNLNILASSDDTLSTVTTPQLRRAMMALVEDEHVIMWGGGNKRFRAVTVADKLKLRDQQNAATVKEMLLARLRRVGIDARWGSPGTVIADHQAMALAEMLEDFPGIAAQYFTNDIKQQD